MPLPTSVQDVKNYQQPHDSIFSRLIYRKISKYLTYYLVKYIPGISAPDVTILSFIVGLVGAVGLLYPAWWARILAFICIQLSFALDCSDGEVARMLGRGSKFGIWFDSISDRTKEVVWFLALGWQLNQMYLAGIVALGSLLVGYLREAKKSIFLEQRKPEIILKSGLHIGTVDVLTFLLSWGALFGVNFYVLWLVAIVNPVLLVKQVISVYQQSNKPKRDSVQAL